MFKAGKIWGETELILANNALEFHRIDYKKGGVCSKHKHEWKWNGFYCMTGQLKIRVWQKDYDLVDETILNPGTSQRSSLDYTIVSRAWRTVWRLNCTGPTSHTTT
jgi:hypothetical protein